MITDDYDNINQVLGSLSESLNNKVDLANGVSQNDVDYVIESYSDTNGNWYRLYKSGWLEQGGRFANRQGTVSLNKPFSNDKYTVIQLGAATSASSTAGIPPIVYPTNTTSFYVYNNTATFVIWYACGQGTL